MFSGLETPWDSEETTRDLWAHGKVQVFEIPRSNLILKAEPQTRLPRAQLSQVLSTYSEEINFHHFVGNWFLCWIALMIFFFVLSRQIFPWSSVSLFPLVLSLCRLWRKNCCFLHSYYLGIGKHRITFPSLQKNPCSFLFQWLNKQLQSQMECPANTGEVYYTNKRKPTKQNANKLHPP